MITMSSFLKTAVASLALLAMAAPVTAGVTTRDTLSAAFAIEVTAFEGDNCEGTAHVIKGNGVNQCTVGPWPIRSLQLTNSIDETCGITIFNGDQCNKDSIIADVYGGNRDCVSVKEAISVASIWQYEFNGCDNPNAKRSAPDIPQCGAEDYCGGQSETIADCDDDSCTRCLYDVGDNQDNDFCNTGACSDAQARYCAQRCRYIQCVGVNVRNASQAVAVKKREDCKQAPGLTVIYSGADTACGVALGVIDGKFTRDDQSFNPSWKLGNCGGVGTTFKSATVSGSSIENTVGFEESAGYTYEGASVNVKFTQSTTTSTMSSETTEDSQTVGQGCAPEGCERYKSLMAYIDGDFCMGEGCEADNTSTQSGSMTIPLVDKDNKQDYGQVIAKADTDEVCS